MGKDRPAYTPSEKAGAHVVVLNCGQPRLSGKKSDGKVYRHYTGYPSGQREIDIAQVRASRPEDIVTLAVRRMLPKTRMGHSLLKRLKVYPGTEHPHTAQQPVKVEKL
jgi:large subunit ribosomal protein L13